jgi:hypothetical protein
MVGRPVEWKTSSEQSRGQRTDHGSSPLKGDCVAYRMLCVIIRRLMESGFGGAKVPLNEVNFC